ncbi:MAG: hypothetical protein QX198_11615 [Methylococcaceae bacterium]
MNNKNDITSTSRSAQKAYVLASKAIHKALGPKATHEEFFDLVVLLATWAVSGGGNLSGAEIHHNYEIFSSKLEETIAEYMAHREQTPNQTTQTTKRLM